MRIPMRTPKMRKAASLWPAPEPAEERLPVVEGEIVGGRVFVSDQLEGAR